MECYRVKLVEHTLLQIVVIRPETRSHLSTLVSNLRSKWQAALRVNNYFLAQNDKWLSVNVSFAIGVTTPTIPGRPQLEFSSCSERTKRRKTEEMRQQYTADELSYATQMSRLFAVDTTSTLQN